MQPSAQPRNAFLDFVRTAAILRVALQAQGGAHLWLAALAGGIAAPLTIGLVLALSGFRFAVTLVQGMHGNGYGVCSGRTTRSRSAIAPSSHTPATNPPTVHTVFAE